MTPKQTLDTVEKLKKNKEVHTRIGWIYNQYKYGYFNKTKQK